MARGDLTDDEWALVEPYLPLGERGPIPDLRRRGIRAVIPEKTDQAANRKKRGSRGGHPIRHDAALYKERNTAARPTQPTG